MSEPNENPAEIADDLICQELDGETIILDLKQEHYFGLNAVGTRIWQLLSEHRTTDEIVGTLQSEFDVDKATLQHDVDLLLERLRQAQLLKKAA